MKEKRVSLMMISATAVLALMAGCTSTGMSKQDQESMLVAAGFKTVTPKTAAQQQKLQTLKVGQVAQIKKNGKTYYIVADPPRNVVYVGGPNEYQAYQQIRAVKQMTKENLDASAQMYQDTVMNWDAWGGGREVWAPTDVR